MTLEQTVAPTTYPLSYDQVKEHLKLIDDSEQEYVEGLIGVATDMAEDYCNRAIMPQTWVLYRDIIPTSSTLVLPNAPLQSVTSIKYLDVDGNEQTYSSDDYTVNTKKEPGEIVLKTTASWPTLYSEPTNSFYVEFVCGYDDADDVPKRIKQAMFLWIHHWYSHREDVSTLSPMMGQSGFVETPKAASFLLFPCRVRG